MDPAAPFEPRAFLKELKTNRRTQGAVLGFLAVLIWMIWSLAFDAPKSQSRRTVANAGGSVDPKALGNLERLPHLAALNQAGELPPIPKQVRDPFLFDAPPPPPPPPPPYKPPPPPTPAEIEAEKARQIAAEAQRQRDMEYNGRPQDLRYIGFLEGAPAGQIGAFMKGEEAIPLTLGTLTKDRWKLTTLTEKSATFQNTKYADMRFELTTRETGPTAGGPTTNDY